MATKKPKAIKNLKSKTPKMPNKTAQKKAMTGGIAAKKAKAKGSQSAKTLKGKKKK